MSCKMATEEIQDAIARGTRRLLVLGPPRSRRLDCIRQALRPLGIKEVAIDLHSVRSRQDVDSACRRAGRGRDFWDAMIRLERQAKRQRLAIVFHDFDGCAGAAGEDPVVDLIWMEAKNRCRGCVVIFTVRNAGFVERCFERFNTCRGFVHEISLAGSNSGSAPAGHGTWKWKS